MSALVSIAFVIAMTPWRAFVLFKLWFWYLVPIWPVLAAPKWNLYGVALIFGWLTMTTKPDDEKQTRDVWVFIGISSFLNPAIILLIGWAIKAICL